MNKNRIINITLAALLFLGVLTILPVVSALPSVYTNNFESETVGGLPTSWTQSNGATGVVSTTRAHTGTKSVYFNSGTGLSSAYIHGPSITDTCAHPNTDYLSYWVYLVSIPSGNRLDLSQSGGGGGPLIYIFSSGSVQFDAQTNLATAPFNTWIDITLSCTGATSVKFVSTVLGISVTDSGVMGTSFNIGGSSSSDIAAPTGNVEVFVDDYGTTPTLVSSLEPYEPYSNGATPTPNAVRQYTLSLSQATLVTSTVQAHVGTKSALFTASGTTSIVQNTFAQDLCTIAAPNNYVQVWIFITSYPAGATSDTIYFQGPATPPYLYISNIGVATFAQNGVSAGVLGSIALNQWTDIKIQPTNCSLNTFTLSSTVLGSTLNADFVGSISGLDSFAFAARDASGANPGGTGNAYYVDDMTYPGFGGGVFTGLSPVATSSSLTSISGFDLGKNGYSAIVREGGSPSSVRVLNGNTLVQVGSTAATNCNRNHGVVALGDEGFGYIHCNTSGTTNPDAITFVGQQGGSYTVNNCANPFQSCDGSFDISGSGISSTDRDALSDIVPGIPGIGHSAQGCDSNAAYNQCFSTTGNQNNYYSLGFSESTGNIATMALSYGFDTGANFETISTTSLTDIANSQDDICGFGNLRIFRAESGVPVKGYTIANTVRNLHNPPDVLSGMTQTFTGSVDALLTGSRIDCANDRIIVNSATQLSIWNYATNSLVFTKTISGGSYNTISGNGSYAAYSDGTTTHVISGSTGNDLTIISNPGTLIDMEMDNCAQSLYLVTSTNVYRYNITGNTTVTPVTVTNGSCIVSSGITSTSTGSSSATSTGITIGGSSSTITNPFHASDDNPFGLNITYISTQLHVSHEGVAVMIGLIFVVIFTIWLWRGTGSPIIALLGAGLGLVVATLFGFINVWVIMVVVLFLVVMLGKMIFGGFTGGSGEE